jgi:hypothetical protein
MIFSTLWRDFSQEPGAPGQMRLVWLGPVVVPREVEDEGADRAQRHAEHLGDLAGGLVPQSPCLCCIHRLAFPDTLDTY